jgi:two-component system sensor histidine kinase KdpD
MNERRPDPDALLALAREEEARARRGRLKVFLGASAGVGKTFAMLVEAHERRRAGTSVVVGVVETHGRAETQALIQDLEVLPRHPVEYRGATLLEFDLDGALARRPSLLLVDELAHTNAPGSRHAKRWQDVEELLDAGIEVYTTLNVQHLESLNDVVAQITGVVVRETIPDLVLERADVVELVDLPPEDLLQRFREGKVYVPEQAERAVQNFFNHGNLLALRELALRSTAERVDAQMQDYRSAHAIRRPWPVSERLLVTITPSARSARLVRSARRIAAALHAEWIVVHVERPGELRSSGAADERLQRIFRLAERLGAETATLTGQRVSDEIVRCARERNATRILVGKPTRPRWLSRWSGSLVDDLVRQSGEADVYVIGDSGERFEEVPARSPSAPAPRSEYAVAIGAVALATGLSYFMSLAFEPSILVMVYLLVVLWVASRGRVGPSVLASFLSVASFDFFFVPPHLTFAVSDTQYLLTFVAMLAAALLVSTLTIRMRGQAEAAGRRERRTASLYGLGRGLVSARTLDQVLDVAGRHGAEVFESRVAFLLPDVHGRVALRAGDAAVLGEAQRDRGVAQWVFDHDQIAGLGTATLPASPAMHLPLVASAGTVGVVALEPADATRLASPETQRALEAFANQTALAIERAQLADEAEHAQVAVETERLRNALLSSVSHDLRTPLAAITGATSILLEKGDAVPPSVRRDLVASIDGEARRLNRLLANLLDITRLEAGQVEPHREWHSLEELIGAAVGRLEDRLGDRPIELHVPPGLPLVPLDDVMVEQALFNLLDNAVKYSPAGTPITVSAGIHGESAFVTVADRGPGIPEAEREKVFEKFFRGQATRPQGGAGLGLAIVRGIVMAHGGTVAVEARPGGGALFRMTFPLGDQAPPSVEEQAR